VPYEVAMGLNSDTFPIAVPLAEREHLMKSISSSAD